MKRAEHQWAENSSYDNKK